MKPWRVRPIGLTLALATLVTLAPVATLTPTPSQAAVPTASPTVAAPTPTPRTGDSLRAMLDAASLREHLQALQGVADVHGSNRATGTSGFEASVAYVAQRLESAGYEVERAAFDAGTNVIVERAGTRDEVVMIGAHLDSVAAGPGINDNGSGVAALLVIAEALATLPAPDRTIRLAFWDAEEGGPFGSPAYVDSLAPSERDRIGAYLNLDIIGSPNAIRFVYAEADAAPGSDLLTRNFAAYFNPLDLPWSPIDLNGASDHGPFTAVGIPTGGLFSGGHEPVTDAQAERFDAIAGSPADPCSHRDCDNIANVDLVTLEEMTRAVAHVLVSLVFDD